MNRTYILQKKFLAEPLQMPSAFFHPCPANDRDVFRKIS